MVFYYVHELNEIKSKIQYPLHKKKSNRFLFRLYDDALADLLAAKTLDPTNTDLDRYINRLHTDLQQCHETLL